MSRSTARRSASRPTSRICRLHARGLAAYHQAGHAVIGALLGARVLGAELWDGPPPGGEVRIAGLEDEDSAPADHRVVRLLAYRLAGPIAEAIAEAGSMALQGDPGYR